jgi:hypothetical protein
MASIKIPGAAGVIEAKAARLNQIVAEQFDIVNATPQPEQKVRRPSAGDLGRPLTTARLT